MKLLYMKYLYKKYFSCNLYSISISIFYVYNSFINTCNLCFAIFLSYNCQICSDIFS